MIKPLFLFFLVIAQAGAELKVASYNIRYDNRGDRGVRDWGRRAPGVLRFLKENQFSIIGLQEARLNQLLDLRKGLLNYRQVGAGRDDGKNGGEFSPLLYDHRVWRVDDAERGTFWLSATPEKPGSMTWGNEIPRICSWARFVGKDGKGIYVFNTHWDHRSQTSREKAADLILSRMKSRKHAHEVAILMGDFNATVENPAVKTLLESGLLSDPGESVQKLTFNRWQPGLQDGLRIDHIFITPSTRRWNFEIIPDGDPVNSDHHPLVLTAIK